MKRLITEIIEEIKYQIRKRKIENEMSVKAWEQWYLRRNS